MREICSGAYMAGGRPPVGVEERGEDLPHGIYVDTEKTALFPPGIFGG